MRWLAHYFQTSIGAKQLMALTGLALVLFVTVHMLGNLQILVGQAAINSYAEALQGMPELLWAARIGLLAVVALHLLSAVRLFFLNRAARPVRYARKDYRATSYAARTMIWGGVIVVLFVGYHLAHFTLMWTNPEFDGLVDDAGRHDVYTMVVFGFQQWPIAVSYIVAVAALCLHLSHGIPSFLQSLGLHHPRYSPTIDRLGPALALLLFLGFAAVPVAVSANWLQLTGGI